MAVTSATDKTSAQLLGVKPYEDSKVTPDKTSANMGKQDFLTLFTAQLKNQNPLDPVKNEAFVAQLAQFSQLEALTNMQGSLDSFVKTMSGQRMLEGAALIGKQVPLLDGTAQLAAGGSVQATVDLPDGASGVKATIRDSSGRVVQELIAGAQDPGPLDFTWNGQDSTGAAAAPGAYKITATAVVGGSTKTVGVQTLATIRSVRTDAASGDVRLELAGGQSVLLSTVRRIVN